jgi:hypothetical protein
MQDQSFWHHTLCLRAAACECILRKLQIADPNDTVYIHVPQDVMQQCYIMTHAYSVIYICDVCELI